MGFKSFIKLSCLFLLVSLNVNSNEKNEYIPKANAGFDQFAKLNQVIELNASNSTDKDGNRLNYQWRIVSKPKNSATLILEPSTVTAKFKIDQPGSYEIELLVSDGIGSSSVDSLLIDTSDTTPQLPTFHDQKVIQGESAYVDGSGIYDPDGDDITFDWSLESKPQKSNAIIQDSDTKSPVITTDAQGKYSVRLQVSDYESEKTSNLFSIFAVDSFDKTNKALGCVLDRIFFDGFDGLFNNSSPLADVGSDKMGVIGQIIALDGSLSSDIDLDSLTYSWSLLTSPNGSAAVIEDTDQMIASLSPDVTGDYVAQLIVNDGCLDSGPDSALVTISVNQSPEITSSPDTSIRESQAYSYQVTATDPEGHELDYELTVSPAGSTIDENGLITWTSLSEGSYPVSVLVTDEYGASDSQSYDIAVVANNAPFIQSFPLSSAEQDFDYAYQLVVTDADNDAITYQLINPVAGMAVDTDGLITWSPDAAGSYQVEVQADDGFGGTDTQIFILEVILLPPDPVDIAPPLSRTDFPPFIETINFLYDAIPPVQIGMPGGTIQDYRAAVMKGRALAADGDPLAGVKVTINNHPDFGHTFTREDGQYDMVVNGGGTLTVNFEKGGYLPVQRDVKTPWENYAYSEDVVLIRLDNKVTSIDLSDTSQDFQIAQGSVVTDIDGTRQATLLFPNGIAATMELNDGSTQPITELNVRATEYTVGDLGINRMPGDLPGASGYTYAVELSVDAAILNDAVRVDFDQPVPFYVDNFLNFPQGEPVPLGYYDREKAYWMPTPDGRVIKILRIENNSVVLDVTNDGVDNDATQIELEELNISTSELTQMALLFSEGKTLWRSQINHFTPFDCNWPFAPPDDIQDPPEDPPYPEPPEDEEDDTPEDEPEEDNNEDPCEGCIIIANNRTLKEAVPIIGTNYNLYYRSGNNLNQTEHVDSFELPLTRTTVDPLLRRIELTVNSNSIGGRLKYNYLPADGLTHTIDWDGKDPYGRFTHKADISYIIKYFYDAVYISPRDERERSFASYWDRGVEVYPSRADTEVFLIKQNRIKLYRYYSNNSITNNQQKTLRGDVQPFNSVREEQLKLGGWSIENHHIYNPIDDILYMGDGFKRAVTAFEGQVQNYGGNGRSALSTEIGETKEIAESPDGSIYFHDDELGQIRKITTDGTLLRAAGKLHISPPFPFCNGVEPVEGESQFDLCLTNIDALFVGDNGDIYFAYDRRIRKINRDGFVNTIAGTGEFGNSNDGTPALSAKISAVDIKIAKDGTFYFLEQNGLLRLIDENGLIKTVAGGGFLDPFDPDITFDGILATETELFQASSFDVSDDGSIVIADTGHECVRHVTTDGYIYTMPGSSPCYVFLKERGGGHETQSRPNVVMFDGNGAVIYHDSYDPSFTLPRQKFVKIHPYGLNEILNSSESGFDGDGEDFQNAVLNKPANFIINTTGEIIIADTDNKRIRKVRGDNSIVTIAGTEEGTNRANQNSGFKALSFNKGSSPNVFVAERDGSVIYEFSPNGVHLKTLDALNARELTTFNYDSNGLLSSIVDEDGLLTILTRDANDMVTEINSPYGKTTEVDYFVNGLLKQVKDPLDNHWDMEYLNGNLSAFIDRNDNRYEYTYDSAGLLETDLNPIGGGWQISTVNDVAGSSTVTMTSGEGRIYEFFKDKTDNNKDKTYINTLPDGTQSTKEINTGMDYLQDADGSEYFADHRGTDRLGSHIKFITGELIKVPGGQQMITSSTLDETTSAPDVITPVLQSTKITSVNSLDWVSIFDVNLGIFGGYQYTTPELRTSLVTLDSNKRIKSAETNGLLKIEYGYDSNGRIQTINRGSGASERVTSLTYYNSGTMNGELHTVTNAVGHTVSFEYGLNGRVIKQVLPDTREILYAYDSNNNLTSLTPPGKPTHTFEYNGMDQETEYTPPTIVGLTTPETMYEYNLDQQLTKTIRPDGLESTLTYNSTTGKLESNTLPIGTYNFAYDAITGKLDQIISPDGITLDYEFDGFLPTKTTWSGNVSGNVSRTYDSFFRVDSRSVNSVHTINFNYDNDNLLTQAGDLSIGREAQKGGLMNSTSMGNISTTISYNDFGEMAVHDALLNNVSFYSNTYTRDKLGRIIAKSEVLDGVTTDFEYDYDLAGRLAEVKTNGITTKTWTYDDNSNRTHENGILIASYDDQDRLLTYDGSTYAYSDNGELQSKTTGIDITLYSYDVLGNLLSVTQPDGTLIEYLIDGRGRRVGKKVNGVFIKGWLYKDGLNPIAEINELNQVTIRFVYADKLYVPSFMIVGADKYRIVANHLGSPIKIIHVDTGVVAQQLTYDTWGNITADTNPGFQPFGFAGGHYDPDTELVRFGTRDYDSDTSRWTTKDTVKFNGSSTNLYDYVSQDPINYIDPSGKSDLNLIDKYRNRDNRSLYDDAENFANDPSEIILVAHGSEHGLVDDRKPGNTSLVDYDELADEIINLEKHQGGMPVRILGCDAANAPEGGESPAQKLADALKRKGGNNPVIAPSESVRPTSPNLYKKAYKWSTFKGK